MHAFKTLMISAIAAAFVAAAPATPEEKVGSEGPSAQAYKLITVCNNINMGGNCLTWFGDLGACLGLAEYNDAVSSATPDGNKNCWLYEHANCQGRSLYLPGPAYDLRQQNFNDIASSYRCYFK